MSYHVEMFSEDMKSTIRHNYANGSLYLYTLSSHFEKPMQDALYIVSFKDTFVAGILCDGMGGHPGAEDAVQAIFKGIKENFNEKTPTLPLRELLLQTIDVCNQKVKDLKVGAGSTIVAFGVEKNTLRVYHAGDSIGRVIGARGKVYYATIDHSPLGHALESGVIAKEQAQGQIDDFVVSNGLGFEPMTIEVSQPLTPNTGDLVFISSDNMPKNFEDDKIIELCSQGEFDKRGELFIETIQKKSDFRQDDTSFLLFRFN